MIIVLTGAVDGHVVWHDVGQLPGLPAHAVVLLHAAKNGVVIIDKNYTGALIAAVDISGRCHPHRCFTDICRDAIISLHLEGV